MTPYSKSVDYRARVASRGYKLLVRARGHIYRAQGLCAATDLIERLLLAIREGRR